MGAFHALVWIYWNCSGYCADRGDSVSGNARLVDFLDILRHRIRHFSDLDLPQKTLHSGAEREQRRSEGEILAGEIDPSSTLKRIFLDF